MNNTQKMTIDKLKHYRDDVISCLKKQLELLDELNEAGLVTDLNKSNNSATQQKTTILTSKNLPEKKTVLEEEIKKLQKFDVVLSVVGTMKSGKSTTINAIVGREIMPNRNRPMTALPTLIIHNPTQTEPVLKFHNQEVREFLKHLKILLQRNPSWKQYRELKDNPHLQSLIEAIERSESLKQTYHGEEDIFTFLSYLNDVVRLTEMLRHAYAEERGQGTSKEADFNFPYQSCCNIDQLPSIEVAFSHLSEVDQVEGRLILLDTPGPNEAGQDKLRKMLEEQLQRSSAVLLILDYTQLKSDAEQEVREQIEAIPDIDQSRLFALVNKFDQKNANSDDAETTKKMIHGDLLKGKIELEHIYPVSAQQAYLANRMLNEIDITGEKPAFTQYDWVQDFAKRAFGAVNEEEWHEDISEKQVQRRCSRLIDDSHMADPIRDAIIQTQREAPHIAIRSALTKVSRTLDEIHNVCEITFNVAKANTEEELTKLKKKVETLTEQVNGLGKIQNTVKKDLAEITKKEIDEIKINIKNLRDDIKDDIASIFSDVILSHKKSLNEKKQERKKKRWLSLMSQHAYNEYADGHKKAQLILSRNSGDTIVFDSESARDEFYQNMSDVYTNCGNNFLSAADYIIKNGKDQIDQKLEQVEKKCKEIFNSIDTEFRKDGFDLHISCPELSDFQGVAIQSLTYNRKMKKETKEDIVEKSGLFASITRFFGWGGYKKVQYTVYEDSKSAIQKQILQDLDTQLFSKVELEIESMLKTFSNQFIEEYVGKVKHEAEQLVNELQTAIVASEDMSKNQEKRRKTINHLKRISDEIASDLQKIAGIFNVKLRKSEDANAK